MRRISALLALVLAVVLNSFVPAFATGLGQEFTFSSNTYFLDNESDPTLPVLLFDSASGQTKIYNKTTKGFDDYAPAAPAYPDGAIWSTGFGYRQKDGSLIYVAGVQTPNYLSHWIIKNTFSNGAWGTWQPLVARDDAFPNTYPGSYVNVNGHDVLTFRRASGDYSHAYFYVGTNASGSWQELKLTDSYVDVLYPESPLSVPGQISPQSQYVNYTAVSPSFGQSTFQVVNGKIALLGYAQFDTANFTVDGTTFANKFQ